MTFIKKQIERAITLVLSNRFVLNNKLKFIEKCGVLTILCLHRVAPFDSSTYAPLSPKILEDLLIFLKKNFQITTFSELNDDFASKKPKLILSFDDGYKDFIQVTVPILRKHQIRVNQNIIPECIELQLPPLNVIAQDFIGRAPDSLLNELCIPGLNMSVSQIGSRQRAGLLISRYLKNRSMEEQRELKAQLMPQFNRFDSFKPTEMMTREDISSLIDEHEFGVHSYSHATMAFESDDFFKNDLLACEGYFLKNFSKPVSIYSFPNGSYTETQLSIAQHSNFKHILLVGETFNQKYTNTYSRFGFYADTLKEGYFRALGGIKWPYFRNQL